MKITSFELKKVPPSWVWLFIHTDAGISGIGEPFLENHGDSVIAEVQRLEPLLLGRDPRQIELIWEALYNAGVGYKGGPVTMSALSGIDMALWDIAGKDAGKPVYQLLGGACRDRVRMYRATGGSLPHTVEPGQPYRAGRAPGQPKRSADPQDWGDCARVLVQEWGFKALKAHFGPGEGLEAVAQIERWAEIFAAVKEGAGPGVDVAVDIPPAYCHAADRRARTAAPALYRRADAGRTGRHVGGHCPQYTSDVSRRRTVDGQVDLLRRDQPRCIGGGPARHCPRGWGYRM
jgi:galactonate dehydratase